MMKHTIHFASGVVLGRSAFVTLGRSAFVIPAFTFVILGLDPGTHKKYRFPTKLDNGAKAPASLVGNDKYRDFVCAGMTMVDAKVRKYNNKGHLTRNNHGH